MKIIAIEPTPKGRSICASADGPGRANAGAAGGSARFYLTLLMAPLLAALSATPAAALTINGFTAAGNERFASGYPGAPVANTSSSFIGAGYNWSGVGWTAGSSNWSFALLGPDQVLIANHVRGDVGPTIQFTNASGQVFNFTVASEQGTHSGYTNDLATATLATPIPASDNIQYYSILFQGYAPATYVGDNLLLYGNYEGQGPAVGWNQISQAGQLLQNASGSYGPDYSNYLYYGYDSVSPNRTVVQNGDSGSPTFIVTGVKGQMYLAGAHYALNSDDSDNPIGGYDSFTSLSLPTLDADMGPSGYLPYVVTPVTARWNGGTSSSWATAANWSSTSGTASVPGDVMSGGSVAVCASVEFDGAATTPHTITLDGAQTVTSITFASAAGANGFTLTGANTLTIGEAGLTNLDDDVQTLACPVALRTSQRWTIGSGGLAVTGSINLGSGTTGNLLLVEGSGSAVFSGALSGSTGSLAVDGGATLTLNSSAGNSYGGSTFINGATLVISQDNDLGAAPSVTASNQLSIDGGTLQAAATLALNANRGIALGNLGGTLAVVGGATLTGNSPIAGSGAALAVAGPGSVVLTASNSYSGPTTVSDGVLTLSGSGSIAKSSGYTVGEGTLRLDNSAGTLATNRTNTAATIALQGGTLQIVAAGATTATLGNLSAVAGENVYTLSTTNTANTLVVSNGTLSRSVGATVNFTGTFNSTNRITFSGLSGFIDQGTFANGADFAAYDTTLNTIRALEYGIDPNTAAVGVIAAGDHVKLTATPAAQNSLTLLTLNLAGSGVSFPLAGGQTLVLSDGGLLKSGGGAAGTLSGGGLATAAGVELVVRTDTAADSLTISTPIAAAGALTKSGAGLLVLSSTANSYGGPTTVTAGTLALGAAQTLPATSTLALAGSGVFDLAGYSQTVAGLSLFDGTITNSNRGNPATLWLGGNSGAVLYDGVGGGATIAADNFMLATSSAAAGSHVFTIARGLGVSDLTVTSAIGNGSAAPQSLVKSGPGILTLSGSNTYTGATDVLAGTLALGASGAIPGNSNVSVSGGTLNLGGYSSSAGAVTLQSGLITGAGGVLSGTSYTLQGGTISVSLGGSATLTMSTTGTAVLSGSNTYTGGTNLSAGTLSVGADSQLGAASGALLFNGGVLQITGTGFNATPRTLFWGGSGGGFDIDDANNTFVLGSSQTLSGSGALAKSGEGTLQLGGAVNSTAVSIDGGTLRLSANNQLASSPVVSISYDGVLDTGGYNQTLGGLTFSGGGVTSGAGTLTLAGSVSYLQSIWTAYVSGNLNLGAATRTFDVVSGSGDDLVINAVVSGAPGAGINKTDTGQLTLAAANTYTGGTAINGGTLLLSNANAVAQSTVSVNVANGLTFNSGIGAVTLGGLSGSQAVTLADIGGNAVTLNVGNDGATTTFSGVLGGSGTLSKVGSGTLALTNTANSYSGGTTISGGTLKITAGAVLGASAAAITFSGNGTLQAGAASVALSSSRDINIDSGVTATLNANGGALTVAGPIGGGGALQESGSGTVTLSGSNSYAGGTTVSGGTLVLTSASALASAGALVVSNGGSSVVLSNTADLMADDNSLSLIGSSQWTALAATAQTAAASSPSSISLDPTVALTSADLSGSLSGTPPLEETAAASTTSGMASVPEPAMLALLASAGLFGLPWWLGRRRRDRC